MLQVIARRTSDEYQRKRLYKVLKRDDWLSDSFLHRQIRQHFKHGKSEVANHFIVRSDKYSTKVINRHLTITIKTAK